MRKKCCYVRGRTWVNTAVCPCLHSFLTHNKHHLFENKMWEIYIFIQKCIPSFIEVVHYRFMLFLHVRVYLYMYTWSCMWLYNRWSSIDPSHGRAKAGRPALPTYNSSVRIRNVALRTCQKRWTIGKSGERGSRISVLVVRQDDDEY